MKDGKPLSEKKGDQARVINEEIRKREEEVDYVYSRLRGLIYSFVEDDNIDPLIVRLALDGISIDFAVPPLLEKIQELQNDRLGNPQ